MLIFLRSPVKIESREEEGGKKTRPKGIWPEGRTITGAGGAVEDARAAIENNLLSGLKPIGL